MDDKPFHLADREPVAKAIEAAAGCDTLDELYDAIAAYRGTEASHTVHFTRPFPTARENPIMVIAEKHEETDQELRRPFSGHDAGFVMRNVMDRFNLDPNDIHFTFACHYPPSLEEAPNATNLAASRPFLAREIQIVRPRAILCLGRVVLDSLFGIRKITPYVGTTMLWRRGGFSTQAMITNSPAQAAKFRASIPDFENQIRDFLQRFGMPDGQDFVPQIHDKWWREAA